jgi:hypothetical protein
MDQELTKALECFVEAIEATGGIAIDGQGYACPVADPDWIDLGDAYLKACRALGRKPVQTEDENSYVP